jgi:hypothetical protein
MDILCCHPVDEALPVLVRVIYPANWNRAMTVKEYRGLCFRWVSGHNLESPLAQRGTAPVARVSRSKCSVFSAERHYVKQTHTLHRAKTINH